MLVTRGHCDVHRQQQRAAHRRFNAGSTAYDSQRWRRASRQYLAAHPFCVDCLADGKHRAATDCDHEVPHRGDPILFWDRDNWRGRCHRHHALKTAREVRLGRSTG